MTNKRRRQIVACARSWIGTPYHHQASLKQVGTDCLGLVRGVYREIYGVDVKPDVAYSRDWAEASGEETMLQAAHKYLYEVERSSVQPGDVLIFRFRDWMVAKHAAILATPLTMVHAIEGAKTEEVSLNSWWQRHIASIFSFEK